MTCRAKKEKQFREERKRIPILKKEVSKLTSTDTQTATPDHLPRK